MKVLTFYLRAIRNDTIIHDFVVDGMFVLDKNYFTFNEYPKSLVIIIIHPCDLIWSSDIQNIILPRFVVIMSRDYQIKLCILCVVISSLDRLSFLHLKSIKLKMPNTILGICFLDHIRNLFFIFLADPRADKKLFTKDIEFNWFVNNSQNIRIK